MLRFLAVLYAAALPASHVHVRAWLPQLHAHSSRAPGSIRAFTSTTLRSEQGEGQGQEDPSQDNPNLNGKMIVERTMYSLSPGSRVAVKNALVIEERLRYLPNPERPGYVLPHGQRTWILREGLPGDEIDDVAKVMAEAKPIYRIDHGPEPHDGTIMDPTVATALFLSSNPQAVQGSMMQLDCETGLAALVGSIGATAVKCRNEGKEFNVAQNSAEAPLSIAHTDKSLLMPQLHKITLTDPSPQNLDKTLETVKRSRVPTEKVVLRELKWKGNALRQRRLVGSPTGEHYRVIVGSDIDFSYPSAADLARVVAHCLLPSNPDAIAASESAAAGTSFGGLGMDMAAPRKGSMGIGLDDGGSENAEDKEAEINPNIPPVFFFVCPDTQPDFQYLRQFLERGFRMDIRNNYIKLVKHKFAYHIIPDDTSESDIDTMELQFQKEASAVYESIVAIHHPEYGGTGTEEIFFPLENGSYEGGGRTYTMDTETEGGSFLA